MKSQFLTSMKEIVLQEEVHQDRRFTFTIRLTQFTTRLLSQKNSKKKKIKFSRLNLS